jgi:DNA-binding NarL/FixJ family response regulator
VRTGDDRRSLGVVVADDAYLLREGICRVLRDDGGIDVLDTAGDAPGLLAAVDRLSPHVVVTDIRMPPGHGMEGIACAHAIRARHPGTGVVVVSQYADAAYALELFRDGTAGLCYVLKEHVTDREQLVGAVRLAAAGGSFVDPVVVDQLVSGHADGGRRDPLLRLTSRESDVLREMAKGLSNRGIADSLHLSESAVEKHIASVFTKLDLPPTPTVHRRVAAVLTLLRDRKQV